MDRVTRFKRPDDLTSRQTLTIELPRFLIRAFEQQIETVNRNAAKEARITLEHLIEHHLADHLSIAEIAHLEPDVPGLTAAVSEWIRGMDGE